MGIVCPARVRAENSTETEKAENISGMKIVTASNGIPEPFRLFDGNVYSSRFTKENATLTLEYEDGIGSLYLLRTTAPGGYTVTDNTSGTTVTAGQTLLLHDFADLVALFGCAPTSITICFGPEPMKLAELYVFTPGEVPNFVQKWNLPADNETDLLLLCAHGDDDQIFSPVSSPTTQYIKDIRCR